jgi:hypothetical protein
MNNLEYDFELMFQKRPAEKIELYYPGGRANLQLIFVRKK